MSRSAVERWLRARSAAEVATLAAAAVVFGYVGWDSALWDARLQLLLHLIAVGAALALGAMLVRGHEMPRTALELPLLGLLAAFALATVSAMNVGMSLRGMASITAFTIALPLALIAVRHRPSWVGVVTSVPVLALAVPSLALIGWRRVEWVLAGGPGLPPLRLPSEGTPFGSVAVPPFVIWPAWALAGLIENARWRRMIRTGLVVVGVPFTVLSGSRSAWLAIGVTAIVAGVPWAWARRGRLQVRRWMDPRSLLSAGIGLVGVAVVAALVVPRLTALSSVFYRIALWRDTLTAWATDPLLGIGPGFMSFARQAAAADGTFPVRQPHSHNLPLGVLGDAGLLGLAVALLVVATILVVAGPWRSRTPTGRAAALVLLGLGIGGMSEDLTFLPNFNLLAIGLLAVALLDAGAVRWRPVPSGGPRRMAVALAGASGAVLLSAMVTADAGSISYRVGMDAVAEGRWDAATAGFRHSERLDPWHPATPKALAVAAAAAGDPATARDGAEVAVARNPGDGPSWTNLALACVTLDDRPCAERALRRAVATAPFGGSDLANAALAYDALGMEREADDAFRRSLLATRSTAFAVDWPRDVTVGDLTLPEELGAPAEMNRLLAMHVLGEPIRPDAIKDPGVRALAHALVGDRTRARAAMEAAIEAEPGQSVTWELAIVLAEHWGEPIDRLLRIGEVVRGGRFPDVDHVSRTPRFTWDLASFRGVPLDGLPPDAVRMRTTPPFPWILLEELP